MAGDWVVELHRRHRKSLTFPELRKGVAALSHIYVEKRSSIGRGRVFEGAAKRAAFACFYSPLHFLLVSEMVKALGAERPAPRRILDLGCGLGVAGAAWASACDRAPWVLGFEKNAWAAGEARLLLPALGVRGRIHQKPLEDAPRAGSRDAIVAAFTVNELDEAKRDRLLSRLLAAAARGAAVLVVEPIARKANPWWPSWSAEFRSTSGREDHWRFAVPLPEPLEALDRASGLDHRELTARSLFLPLT